MPLSQVNVHDSTIRKRVDKIAIHGRVSEVCFIFWKLYVTSDVKLTKNFIKNNITPTVKHGGGSLI